MNLPFGKYKNQPISEIDQFDRAYLRWVVKLPYLTDDLKKHINETISKPVEPPSADQPYLMTFGKYKGIALDVVYERDRKYFDYLDKSDYVRQNMPDLSELISRYP